MLSKILGTAIPCVTSAVPFRVTTTGLLCVTVNVLFITLGAGGNGGLSSPGCGLDSRKFESSPGTDAPSPSDSPPEELSRILKEKDTTSGLSKREGPFDPFLETPTTVVPALGTSVKAIGTPNVLTGHGGGGVMKVGSGLGSPEKIVVVKFEIVSVDVMISVDTLG